MFHRFLGARSLIRFVYTMALVVESSLVRVVNKRFTIFTAAFQQDS